MPKILRLMDRLNTGGPAVHAILLARHLNAGQWTTVLAVGREEAAEGNMLGLAERLGVNPVRIPSLGREIGLLRDGMTLLKLIALIRKEKPDIVHTHKSKAGALGRLAARLCGVKIVVHTFHGHVFHGYFGPLKSAFFVRIERMLARLTDRIVAVSARVKKDLLEYGIAAESSIQVVPLGLDLGRFLRSRRGEGRVRSELGLAPGQPLVGIVARLVPIKRIDLFLEASAEARRALPQARFVVVGDGELRGDLESRCAALGLSEAVRFLGFRDDLEVIYPDLDLLVLCSDNEGSPVSLIEGLSSGCAVVATNVGGVSDVVKDGRTGVLVPPRDPRALAAAMAVLLADPERCRSMGEAGRAEMGRRFSIERLVADLEKLYADIARAKAR